MPAITEGSLTLVTAKEPKNNRPPRPPFPNSGDGVPESESAEPLQTLSSHPLLSPCLHGSVVLDDHYRVRHISKPLRATLKAADGGQTRGKQLLEVLEPLLEVGWGDAAVRLRLWFDNLATLSVEEVVEPLVLRTEKEERRLQLELQRVGNGYSVLAIEEFSTGHPGASKEVFALLYRDPLTGTANRALFEHKLDAALAAFGEERGDSVTVLLIDLDRFKAVNDTLGHAIGDTLLGVVGERLLTSLRDADTLARLGGDEFGILLHDEIDESRIAELARRLIDLLQRPYLIDGHVINVGASIGAARAPEDGLTRDHLLRSADLALYHSKSAGRGVFHFFTPAMEERAHARRALELDLRKALVLKQFELHYQPQIEVEAQRVIGLEGLLRWRHPERGMLLPGEFLPLAEEIGLAIPIGNWVLRTACRDAAAWPGAITVAVNVSPVHFESPEFARSAEYALKAAHLLGSHLEIEVTEEILLRDSGNVRSTLNALRSQGVRVVMDSFGTGLASLSQVVNFPFDKIKIDRSLIGRADTDGKGRAILRAISALGQSLGIATLAEGVETPEHLAHVRAEGCHTVQGFYYSKAVPLAELDALLLSLSPQNSSFDRSRYGSSVISDSVLQS
ncbi:MAG: putative bifunctional diguanylate cyclase/phosphodiesterase [Janthinobacterium lividum]